jgi:hypothetical protein
LMDNEFKIQYKIKSVIKINLKKEHDGVIVTVNFPTM